MPLNWTLKKFDELTTAELYAILRLRNEVFVVEQNCPYQDADDRDQVSWHFCGWDGGTLVAYTRLIPPGLAYPEASIGRVVTSPAYRKTGAGRALMQHSIEKTFSLFETDAIQIGAQLYLKKFYESLGFVPIGEGYLEDGIPHIHMILKK
ncbi:MAG: GNAT family N-acetyltransferase [Chitinophagaceae bacterium]|nr:GNAT family N-acetyltransferase [Chitinophagaceae bacterium]